MIPAKPGNRAVGKRAAQHPTQEKGQVIAIREDTNRQVGHSGPDGPQSPERPTALAPSGRQFEIGFGEQRATVVEVGAGIRAYRDGQRDVLHPYPVDAMADGAHGAALIPWPNRLRDGKYHFDGSDYQLALTEPEKHNAIHGLLRWRPWQLVRHDADRVMLTTVLHPMQGRPHHAVARRPGPDRLRPQVR